MGFSSQANDIGQICDAVVNSIKDDVASLTTAATDDTLGNGEITASIVAQETLAVLREVLLHLRILTGEDFQDDY